MRAFSVALLANGWYIKKLTGKVVVVGDHHPAPRLLVGHVIFLLAARRRVPSDAVKSTVDGCGLHRPCSGVPPSGRVRGWRRLRRRRDGLGRLLVRTTGDPEQRCVQTRSAVVGGSPCPTFQGGEGGFPTLPKVVTRTAAIVPGLLHFATPSVAASTFCAASSAARVAASVILLSGLWRCTAATIW